MRLDPWEPDIRTLISRIDEKEIDLQPDFQRGIAWNAQKQAKLVDTVLRGWSIPPLHFLVYVDQTMAVLDGQQRLTSIKRFLENRIPVSYFPPFDPALENLYGRTYQQLDPDTQRRINNYTIRSYRLNEYTPDEPHELFFRLNQPTGLTQAEKRNALMGNSRSQVRDLVSHAIELGWGKELVGFENSRLAYDDTLARLCLHLQERTLRLSTNAARLEQQFRLPEGFSQSVLRWAEDSVGLLTDSLALIRPDSPRLNKATLLSWLLVCARALRMGSNTLNVPQLIYRIEGGRLDLRRGLSDGDRSPLMENYLRLYDDRASLRVADILSVVARDACIWRIACIFQPELSNRLPVEELYHELRPVEESPTFESSVLDVMDRLPTWERL